MSSLRLTVLNALFAALLLVSPARGATIPVYSSVTARASAYLNDPRDPAIRDSDSQDTVNDQTGSIDPLSTRASADVGGRGAAINVSAGVSAIWTNSSQGTIEFGAGWSQNNNGFSDGGTEIDPRWQYVFQISGDASISIDYEAVGAGFGINTFDIIVSGIRPDELLKLNSYYALLDWFDVPGGVLNRSTLTERIPTSCTSILKLTIGSPLRFSCHLVREAILGTSPPVSTARLNGPSSRRQPSLNPARCSSPLPVFRGWPSEGSRQGDSACGSRVGGKSSLTLQSRARVRGARLQRADYQTARRTARCKRAPHGHARLWRVRLHSPHTSRIGKCTRAGSFSAAPGHRKSR